MVEEWPVGLAAQGRNGDRALNPGGGALQKSHPCGLSGAVRSEQTEDFAFFHVEADATHGFYIAVAFYEIFNLKNGSWHRRSPPLAGACKIAYSIPQKSGRLVT